MSYILEALKKSDLERRSGTMAGAASPASFVIASQRRSGRAGAVVLAGGMLATGLALGAWRPWQEPMPPGKPSAVALAPPAEPAAPPPAPAGTVPLPEALPAPATAAPVAAVPAAAAPAPVAEARPQPRPRPLPRERKPARAADPVASGETGTGRDLPESPDRMAGRPAPSPPASPAVVGYGELPAAIKDSLPQFVFGGYAGVEEPEARVAFINNRLVKEGEEVTSGVRLERVGRDGVVLGYQGYRFRLRQ